MPGYLYFASFRSFHFFFYQIWQNNCFLLFLPSPLKVKSQIITHSYKRKGESFLFFSSHSLPLGHVSYCHHFSSVVCRSSVNISHFIQLLRNHRANCNQTLVELSLDGPLPKLCPVIPTTNQDGHQAKNRKKGDTILIVHCCFSRSQNELKF